MTQEASSGFRAGVIEGFYGPPWSGSERRRLFEWMSRWGFDTYFYCLKDDCKNRVIWREDYTATEFDALAGLVDACRSKGIRFVYGLSPGLDIRYSNEADRLALRRRFASLLDAGCADFGLLFDDIPDRMHDADRARWGSLAAAQCAVTNELYRWAGERRRGTRFLFCPTPYCGRMVDARHGGEGYLEIVGNELSSEIGVLWTGPEIVSEEITIEHVEHVSRLLRRKPVIWDNLHANDYDGRRFFCGPYSGRPLGLRDRVGGILTNPNCEFPLNYPALRTLAAYLKASGESWDPREAYLGAMAEWSADFETCGGPISKDDLVLLGDCYYLPYSSGTEAERLFATLKSLLARNPTTWGPEAEAARAEVVRLRDVCARMAELRDRSLFHALGRRVWELREELDLFDRYLRFRSEVPNAAVPFLSDFHRPGTYRGGWVARLQRLLCSRQGGDFVPDPSELVP